MTVRCLTTDSGLSPNRCSELMVAEEYLCNRISHTAFQKESPRSVFYVTDAELSHLIITGVNPVILFVCLCLSISCISKQAGRKLYFGEMDLVISNFIAKV